MSESVGSADSINPSEEEEEDELNDRCNSAGEEIEDEEFDESHIEDGERRGLSEGNFPSAPGQGDGERHFWCRCALCYVTFVTLCCTRCLADDLSDADSQTSTVADEEEPSPNSSEGGSSISMEEDAVAEVGGEEEDVDVADGDDIFGTLGMCNTLTLRAAQQMALIDFSHSKSVKDLTQVLFKAS